jgi:MFS transporter, AAHS family, 4-hydroxybenzoate transporter
MRSQPMVTAINNTPVSATGKGPVAWICFAIAMADGYDTLLLSFIAPLVSKEWHLTPGQIGQLFAVSYAGAAVGAVTTGIAADRWGRRKLLLVALVLSGVGTLACSFVANVTQLMICRCIAGFGLGGAIPAISAITAVHARPLDRPAAVTRMFLGYPIGALVGGTLTAALMTLVGWRSVFVGAGVVTCCLIPLAGLAVTESPEAASGPRISRPRQSVTAVFEPQYLLGTLLLSLATFLILLVSYFLVSWTPTVLTLSGVAPPRAALAGVVLNLGGLIGAYVLSMFMRRRHAAVIVGGCLLVGSLLTAMLGQTVSMTGLIAFICAFAVGVFVIGAQSNLPALTVRFYPSSICASGVGLSMAFGRVGSIVGPLVGGYLAAAEIGWPRLFLLAAIPAFLAGAAVGVLVTTPKGKASN